MLDKDAFGRDESWEEIDILYCTKKCTYTRSGHLMTDTSSDRLQPEAEFLDVIGKKVLRVSFLRFTVTSTYGFYSPLKVVWNWFVM